MSRPLLLACLVFLAACSRNLPTPECDPAGQGSRAQLPCDEAVGEAFSALPSDHPSITRVQFLYGSAKPYDCGMLLSPDAQRVCAYVVFTFTDKSRQYVGLMADEGGISAASPAPY